MASNFETFKKSLQGKKVVLFGATTSGRDLLEHELQECNHVPAYFCDFNQDKWGTKYHGVEVRNPDVLQKEKEEDLFIIITTLFDLEVMEYLASVGIRNFISARNLLNERINIQEYWEERYEKGYETGNQSEGTLLDLQIELTNEVILSNNIENVIEFGCGNGKMLKHLALKNYVGLDISKNAINVCKEKYKDDANKKFFLVDEYGLKPNFELSLSLGGVIASIPDQMEYFKYMNNLFNSSTKFVCIFSSDIDSDRFGHIQARNFTRFVSENFKEWNLVQKKETGDKHRDGDPSHCSFFIYKKR